MSPKALRPASQTLYDEDFAVWAAETASVLRAGRFSELDIEHVAEEIEDMAKGQRRELVSRLTVLLIHLLKWKHQPEKRSPSWQSAMDRQRAELAELFEDSPSLRRSVEALPKAYRNARRRTGIETRLPAETFPRECPFTLEQVLDEDFLPE
jgi:hypothetical protein